jgi:hypothetical protein
MNVWYYSEYKNRCTSVCHIVKDAYSFTALFAISVSVPPPARISLELYVYYPLEKQLGHEPYKPIIHDFNRLGVTYSIESHCRGECSSSAVGAHQCSQKLSRYIHCSNERYCPCVSLIKHCVVTTGRGEWRYGSTILDHGIRWRWVGSFTPRPLFLLSIE